MTNIQYQNYGQSFGNYNQRWVPSFNFNSYSHRSFQRPTPCFYQPQFAPCWYPSPWFGNPFYVQIYMKLLSQLLAPQLGAPQQAPTGNDNPNQPPAINSNPTNKETAPPPQTGPSTGSVTVAPPATDPAAAPGAAPAKPEVKAEVKVDAKPEACPPPKVEEKEKPDPKKNVPLPKIKEAQEKYDCAIKAGKTPDEALKSLGDMDQYYIKTGAAQRTAGMWDPKGDNMKVINKSIEITKAAGIAVTPGDPAYSVIIVPKDKK